MSPPCFPPLTHVQRASKFPSSSIMDQEMFYLLVLAHLSKRASNSLACPGTCPSERNGGTPATRIGAELSCSNIDQWSCLWAGSPQPFIRPRDSAAGWKGHTTKRERNRGFVWLQQISTGAAASIAAAVLGERAEHHLCIDVPLRFTRIRVPVDEPRVDGWSVEVKRLYNTILSHCSAVIENAT